MAMEAIQATADLHSPAILMDRVSSPVTLTEVQEADNGTGASKKRARVEDELAGGFGASTEDGKEEENKRAKRSEGEVPHRTAQEDSEVLSSPEQSNVKRPLLPDIFDAGDDDDYEHSADRARRLSYLTSTGAKPKKNDRYAEKSSFAASSRSSVPPIPSESSSHRSKAPYPFASPTRTSTTRSKMEQQEFVKDSVQNKIVRESGIAIKPKTSKPLDFDTFFQTVATRAEQIKLVTAEQVGLAALMEPEDPDLSNEEGDNDASDEEDEISLDIDEPENANDSNKSEANPAAVDAVAMPPPKIKAPVHVSVRSKKMVVDEEDEEESASGTAKISKPAERVTRPTISLDDFGVEDDDDVASQPTGFGKTSQAPPTFTPSIGSGSGDFHPDESPSVSGGFEAPNSQTSVTEETPSSFKLEPVPTLDVVGGDAIFAVPTSTATPRKTQGVASQTRIIDSGTSSSTHNPLKVPDGVKLKALEDPTVTSKKGSAMSAWLSGKLTSAVKPLSGGAKKAGAKQTGKSSSSSSSSSSASKKSASVMEGLEFFDENAMTGDDDQAPQATLTRLKRTKQLFDDEAEHGFGSDVEEEDRRREESRGGAEEEPEEEEEGGASQDEYEVDEAAEAEEARRRADDIFESDDRAVIRSAIMAQELAREEEEARRATELTLRRDRNAMRMERALNAEANMLLEERRMEERLASRRANRSKRSTKLGGGNVDGEDGEDAFVEISVTSASMPNLPSSSEKEWFMDDDDDDDDDVDGDGNEDNRLGLTSSSSRHGLTSSSSMHMSRRLEALEEQSARRRLASSSQFLLQDENSQSILQLIERANTQHSQASASSFHDSTSQLMMDGSGDRLKSSSGGGSGAAAAAGGASGGIFSIEDSQDAFSLGGFFDRASCFSANNTEHLTKLKATFKGNNTQLQSSALLFGVQRSQDGFGENSQDALPSTTATTTGPISATNSSTKPSSTLQLPKPTVANAGSKSKK